jgi:flagellar biosynthesis protein FlhB
MTAAIAALILGGPQTTARLLAYWRASLAAAPAAGSPAGALADGLGAMARALAAPLGAAAGLALAVGLLQTRGLVALGAIKPDLSRLSPGAGLKRAFGGQAALAVGKGLSKVVLVAVLAWLTVRPVLGGLTGLAGAAPGRFLGALGTLAARLAGRVALVALGLGMADYLFALRRHRRGLRMTREEVKRESKESEGDPSHRAERQRLHRELGEQRMVAEVRKADFVVVNPDHIAVALRYDREGNAAPVVIARGERLVAERIKEVARQAGVPIFRDVTLARSLRDLPEGEEIPAALYEAVAEVLRMVYAMGEPPVAASAQTTTSPLPRPAGAGWKRA